MYQRGHFLAHYYVPVILESAISQFKNVLEKQGFIILPESVHSEVLEALKNEGIDTKHVYCHPPDSWETVVGEGKCFGSQDIEGTAKLVNTCCCRENEKTPSNQQEQSGPATPGQRPDEKA